MKSTFTLQVLYLVMLGKFHTVNGTRTFCLMFCSFCYMKHLMKSGDSFVWWPLQHLNKAEWGKFCLEPFDVLLALCGSLLCRAMPFIVFILGRRLGGDGVENAAH